MKMNNKRLIVLILMILFDLMLHILELCCNVIFPIFPSRFIYTIFWVTYWFIALIIALSLLIKNG